MQASNLHSAPSYTKLNDVKSWSDDISGMGSARSPKDAERDSINSLFRTSSEFVWRSPLHNIRSYLNTTRAPQHTKPEDILRATMSTSGNGTYIDPITNRKVPSSEISHYSSVLVDDANASPALSSEEKSKFYTDLGEYQPASWNEPDGLRKLTPEEQSQKYKDLSDYSTTSVDNLNAPMDLTAEERSKLYKDLGQYNPVAWNEPDGLQTLTPEERSKSYKDLDEYESVRWSEPDGLQEMTPEEATKNYKDLDQYEAVSWQEPDGLRRLTPEEKSKQYDDLDLYGRPFVAKNSVLMAHAERQKDTTQRGEPLPTKVEVPSQDVAEEYDDLDKYGPVKWNEPDGLRVPTPEENSKDYEDLPKYDQYDNGDPATPRVHPEEASKKYRDLTKYSAFPNSGPATERVHPEEVSKRYTDLRSYSINGYEEPERTQHVHPEELTKGYQDLDNYEPQSFDSSSMGYPMHPEEATKQYKDLGDYQASLHDEASGQFADATDPVAASLQFYDSKMETMAQRAVSAGNHRGHVKQSANVDQMDSLTADDIRSQVINRAVNRGMDPILDQQSTTAETPDRDEVEPSSMDESFPRDESTMAFGHVSWNAARMHAEHDPYSKAPQGMETSYAEECGGTPTWPTWVKHHKADMSKHAEHVEPVTYKVLAYDATTQSISVADTNAPVHDSSPSPGLADVLLRLSNPSKFLPHFQPLQAQGYDILTGGGDVLIFRKNRAASAAATQSEQTGLGERGLSSKKKKGSIARKVVMGTVYVGGVAYAVGAFAEHFASKGGS